MNCNKLGAFTAFVFLTLAAPAAYAKPASDHKPRNRTTQTIVRSDIGGGQEATTASGEYVRGDKEAPGIGCPDDAAGHIIARNLGGEGDPQNIFPQNASINSGAFRVWEEKVADALRKKDSTDIDGDGNRDEYLYEHVDVEIVFEFGDSKLPKRPKRVKYCYTPWFAEDFEDERGEKDSEKCEAFDNPKTSKCIKETEALNEWDELILSAKEHMEAQRNLRNPDDFLDERDMKLIRFADVETTKDQEFAELMKKIKRQQDRVGSQWSKVKARYSKLIEELEPYEKIKSTQGEATAWRKRLEADVREVTNVVENKRKKFGSKRVKDTIEHNIEQHENLQDDMRCDEEHDGDSKKPDCVVYKTCTVYEFYPQSSPQKSKKVSTSKDLAQRMNKDRERKNDSHWNHCFDDDGPTDGKGFEGKTKEYKPARE